MHFLYLAEYFFSTYLRYQLSNTYAQAHANIWNNSKVPIKSIKCEQCYNLYALYCFKNIYTIIELNFEDLIKVVIAITKIVKC